MLATTPAAVVEGVRRKLDEVKALQEENRALRAKAASGRAAEIAAGAEAGIVVARVDDLPSGDLRDLAVAVRSQPGVDVVVLGGRSDTGGASLVAAVTPGRNGQAADLLARRGQGRQGRWRRQG